MKKKFFLTGFVSIFAVLCFCFLPPAFAEMKKIDDKELARTHASVTNAAGSKQAQVRTMLDKTEPAISQTLNITSVDFGLNLIIPPETGSYTYGPYGLNPYTGGGAGSMTWVKSPR